MTDQPTPEMPRLGAEGETCSACQAPLAIDQRYCLQCGTRRGESRVDFAGLLPAEPVAVGAPRGGSAVTETTTVQGGAAPAAALAPGPWTPFAMVASIAVLALMLLVGVMIGKDDQPTQVTAAAPVTPVAAATTDPAAETGTKTASGAGSGAGDTGAGGAAGGGGADTGGGSGGGGGAGGGAGVDPNPPPAESAAGAEVVDDAALDALGNTAPEDYAEASKNLPDTIAIPGEPPPVDNEDPGGGTKATVIGG